MADKNFIVDSIDNLSIKMKELKEAQKKFASYSQEQVDKIFYEVSMAANKARFSLAKMAVEETGMGVLEDKVIKNHYAAEYIYNAYKDTKTCGVIEEDKIFGRRLENDDIVDMDDERRAQMVSNLLVVLCSDQRTQPVVNTGSLYA